MQMNIYLSQSFRQAVRIKTHHQQGFPWVRYSWLSLVPKQFLEFGADASPELAANSRWAGLASSLLGKSGTLGRKEVSRDKSVHAARLLSSWKHLLLQNISA